MAELFRGYPYRAVLEKDRAYTVQLGAIDTAGSTCETTFSIPMEQVYMHRTPNAMGLGGYAEGEQVLDLHWDLRARKTVSGAYIRTVPSCNRFTLTFDGGTALLLGGGIHGVVTDTKLEELTREVREHNNFARRMPVVEEKLKVLEHRVKHLENR